MMLPAIQYGQASGGGPWWIVALVIVAVIVWMVFKARK